MVCELCWGELRGEEIYFCPKCGTRLKGPSKASCSCQVEYSFTTVQVGVEFNGAVQRLIHALKYEGKRSLAKRLGLLLADRVSKDGTLKGIELLIPVPLHPSRMRERGYNQSELIAEAVGQRLGLPVVKDVLIRRRRTKTQTKLDTWQRRENVKGAFSVKKPELVLDKRVALVDDVLTTGATLDACAQTLLSAGAREVQALVVARAV